MRHSMGSALREARKAVLVGCGDDIFVFCFVLSSWFGMVWYLMWWYWREVEFMTECLILQVLVEDDEFLQPSSGKIRPYIPLPPAPEPLYFLS
jgi:hypothetical protein